MNHFRAFGFLRLEHCLDGASFASLSDEFESLLAPGSARLPFNLPGSPPGWVASCMGADAPVIVRLATDDAVLELAGQLLGHPMICVQASAYLRSADTVWHSDNPRLDYEALKLYINLDSVDERSGALRVIPGSHRSPLREGLVPSPGLRVEDAFGLRADQLPATALCSRAGDVSAFDLRSWHAVCGSPQRRRVIELSYYADPASPSSTTAFVEQMQVNQRGTRLADEQYFPEFWRQAPGKQHQRGIRRLAELGVLSSSAA